MQGSARWISAEQRTLNAYAGQRALDARQLVLHADAGQLALDANAGQHALDAGTIWQHIQGYIGCHCSEQSGTSQHASLWRHLCCYYALP